MSLTNMSLQPSTAIAIRNVAVATDFSECSERAVQHGLAVARHFGATLHFLHLVRPSKFVYAPEMIPTLDEAAARDCDQLITRLKEQGQLEGVEYRRWVREGEIAEVVGGFVQKEHIDLLVVGTHGRGGIPRLVLGSSAQQIFHSVRCPVLTVGPRAPGAGPELQLKRVLFATDLSQESLAALPYVTTAVQEWHAELDVLHICSSGNPDHARLMEELRSRVDGLLEGSTPVHYHRLRGKPMPCVIDFADKNKDDLIVLGLKPHRALYDGPFWSHAYEIVRRAHCSVLSVRTAPQ